MDTPSSQHCELPFPVIHVISDAVGLTAQAVARAAAAPFGVTNPTIEILPSARNFEEIKAYIDTKSEQYQKGSGYSCLLVFYTILDRKLADRLAAYAKTCTRVVAVDLMSDAITAIASMTGLRPSMRPGGIHVADQHYFRRIEAIEFSIAHDDGRNPQDLAQADIVLLGVSRSSKTPTSIFLSQAGYKVANIPLDPATDPPQELTQVDRSRLFGLMTSAEVLIDIRQRRLGRASGVAARYADPEYVYQDLENAHALMRKLGCMVVHTENRAVEETAQEILRYFERTHPPAADMMGYKPIT